jgi:ribosomal protein L2
MIPKTPWGKLARGGRTKKKHFSDHLIVKKRTQ